MILGVKFFLLLLLLNPTLFMKFFLVLTHGIVLYFPILNSLLMNKKGLILGIVQRGQIYVRTRGRGKVLEQTGGQMSVRGTRQRAVIFLLRYLGIRMKEVLHWSS